MEINSIIYNKEYAIKNSIKLTVSFNKEFDQNVTIYFTIRSEYKRSSPFGLLKLTETDIIVK